MRTEPTNQTTNRTTTRSPSRGSGLASTLLRRTLQMIAVVQLGLGGSFLLFPAGTARLFGLPPAPAWTGWLFAMMAARFLGYGVGMLAAARQPQRHRLWLRTMLLIQAVDWAATLIYLARHDVTLGQVTTAAFLPPIFMTALGMVLRRTAAATDSDHDEDLDRPVAREAAA
jgi:hypothetical protein